MSTKKPLTNFLSAENSACAGCGQIIASRAVVNTLGPDTIVVNATGCLEVTTSQYPMSAWKLPWIHSLFANPAPLASGILAALRHQNKKAKILVQAGDGSTFDIGFGAVSGMWDRGDDIIYVCYDNEIYANTGMQASAATPYGSRTSTTPKGKLLDGHKKNMIDIALSHGLKYVAQTTSGFIDDLKDKVLKASQTKGPSYIQVLSPCIPGWSVNIQDSVKVAQLAVTSGLYPGLEYVDGQLTKVIKAGRPQVKVWDYLQYQSRFRHLPKTKAGLVVLAELQAFADNNIKKYGL